MPQSADHLLLTGDVLGAEVENGEVRLKVGDASMSRGHAQGVPCYGVDGFLAVPNDPDDNGGACQVKYLQDGDSFVATGFRDNRYAEKAGKLVAGDRAIVTNGPTRIVMKRATKTIALYTEQDFDVLGVGKGVLVLLSGDDGTIILRANGCELFLGRSATNQAPELRLSATGLGSKAEIVVNALFGVAVSGALINLDAMGFVTLGLDAAGQRPVQDTVTPNKLNHVAHGPLGASNATKVLVAT